MSSMEVMGTIEPRHLPWARASPNSLHSSQTKGWEKLSPKRHFEHFRAFPAWRETHLRPFLFTVVFCLLHNSFEMASSFIYLKARRTPLCPVQWIEYVQSTTPTQCKAAAALQKSKEAVFGDRSVKFSPEIDVAQLCRASCLGNHGRRTRAASSQAQPWQGAAQYLCMAARGALQGGEHSAQH